MSVAPFVPTPIEVVRKMLEIAEAGQEDVLFDLGCGDGRILFTAVEEFKVRKAVGYDLDPAFCRSINKEAESLGQTERVQAVNENFFDADLSPATIVTLYLTSSGNSKLRPKLQKELKLGARVVSHDFDIQKWVPSGDQQKGYFDFRMHKIFLYRIPDAYTTPSLLKEASNSIFYRARDWLTVHRT